METSGEGGADRPEIERIPRLALDLTETAQCLGVSTKTVRRLIGRGLLRPSKALRHIIIAKSEIERFLLESSQ